MPIKKFYIKGDGKVIDVGFRPALVTIGLNYGLRVVSKNLPEENRVEVIVDGSDQDIKRFWEHVKSYDARPVKDEKPYTVSDVKPYEGTEPDWSYHTSASSMEQVYKGVSSMKGMQDTLQKIDGRFDRMTKRFGEFGKNMKGMGEKLDNISGKLDNVNGKLGHMSGKLDDISGKLDALPEIAKALKGSKSKKESKKK